MIHDIFSAVHSFLATSVADVQTSVDAMPVALQCASVFVLAIIPVVEGDIAAGIGMVAGLDWELTLATASAGTAVAVWFAAQWGARLADRRRHRAAASDNNGEDAGEDTEDAGEDDDTRAAAAGRKLLRLMDRYGLGPAMVLGGFVSPVALNTFALAVAGLDLRRLLFWGWVSTVINVTVVVAGAGGLLHLLLH